MKDKALAKKRYSQELERQAVALLGKERKLLEQSKTLPKKRYSRHVHTPSASSIGDAQDGVPLNETNEMFKETLTNCLKIIRKQRGILTRQEVAERLDSWFSNDV